MGIIKDLISLTVFSVSLYVLYKTTDDILALICVLLIVLIYLLKHIKLQRYIKRELNSQINLLNLMFNSSKEMILYHDLEHNIKTCNKTFCNTFNIRPQDVENQKTQVLLKYLLKEDYRVKQVMDEVYLKSKNAYNSGKSMQFLEKFYLPSGEQGIFNILMIPVCKYNKALSGFIVVINNITEIYKITKEARETSEQFRCMLDNMPMYAFMKDLNNKLIVGSSSFEKMIVTDGKKFNEMTLEDAYEKEYLDFVREEELEIYKTGKPVVIERKISFRGRMFWARVHKAPVYDEDGNVQYLLVMYENMEAEKEIERQKEYFIETLIHDLKIPTLAQLRGLELIKNGTMGEINSEQNELLQQIENSCKYILEMISMVLKAYRFENGQKHPLYEKINIPELILETFENMQNNAKEKDITFLLDMHNVDSLIIEADREDLKTVLMNLISNAILYSNKSQQVIVSVEKNDNYAHFKIINRGIILSERECMTMFDKTLDNAPKYSTIGHGIALYLCKKIIESHKGEIYASTDGINTNIFTFTIPLEEEKNVSQMATLLNS